MRDVALIAASLALIACGAERSRTTCTPVLPDSSDAFSDASAPLPSHFLANTVGGVAFTDRTPPDNRTTNAGATLGRVLFYDTQLSADGHVACASCHRQQFGFGDTARVSIGAHGARTLRRAMPLANARFYTRARYAADERSASLEEQVLRPFADGREFAIPVDTVIPKLIATAFYPALFSAAFGSPDITADRMAAALAQFVRSLVSAHAPFDSMFATGGAPNPDNLTAAQRRGFALFATNGCVNCHRTIAQIPDQANNNGLDIAPTDSGAGSGRFKPASLRNVAVRPPYMHDGRFRTLAEVVAFYDDGVRASPHLDLRLRTPGGSPRRLHFSVTDRAALVAFLESLTDSTFLTTRKFSNPFRCTPEQ